MTIREKIIENELAYQKDRYAKLKEMGAPVVIIENMERVISELTAGDIKVTGETELLDLDYFNGEVKKGKGGKVYICMNNGSILYFPNAKYGRFIRKGDER